MMQSGKSQRNLRKLIDHDSRKKKKAEMDSFVVSLSPTLVKCVQD